MFLILLYFVCVNFSVYLLFIYIFRFSKHDYRFFMFQILNSFDGVNLVSFGQGDILNIRMTLLYSWLTAGDFNIDLQAVLCVEAGSSCLFN
jgi:hypothetical protein